MRPDPAAGPVPRYFAYGSNLDPEQMVRRGVPFRAVVGALLRDHALAFDYPAPNRWLGSAADIVPRPGDRVEGALYELASEDALLTMDTWEGVPERAYERAQVTVEPLDGGAPVRAWTYVVVDKRPEGAPSPGYVGLMYMNARRLGLSAPYVGMLAHVLERSRAELGAQLAVLEALARHAGPATVAEVASSAVVGTDEACAHLDDLCVWGWARAEGEAYTLLEARRADVQRVSRAPPGP